MKAKRTFLTALLVLLVALPALAVDYWGGPPQGAWTRGDPSSTFQHWNFETPALPLPDVWQNPYGDPFLDFLPPGGWEYGEQWECPIELDPRGFVSGWHCIAPEGGTVVLTIPNTEAIDGEKLIFLQITSSKAPTSVSAVGLGGNPGGYVTTPWMTGLPQIQWPGPAPFGGVWYTYNYGLRIVPNPQMETITIEVPFCTVIDQIVVDTLCTGLVPNEQSTWSGVKELFR